MKFLIKVAFWLGVVGLLLPAAPPTQEGSAPQVSAGEAVSAAVAAVSDLRGFCERQPGACVTGSRAIAYIGRRMASGARMIFGRLGEPTEKDPGHNLSHGLPAQNTLIPADLAVPWRAVAPEAGLDGPA